MHEPGNLEVFLTIAAGALASSVYRGYVNSLGLSGREAILDFGSGSGNPARFLAPILQEGGRLTCVDVSERWLSLCQRRLSRYPNVDFLLGDIADLRLPDASFDVVFMHFVLHDIPSSERPRIARHLARVLRSGGKVFLREPLTFIGEQEAGSLLAGAGLLNVQHKTNHIRSQGAVLEAVFVKP